jgi:hypothetical protein
MSEYSRFMKHQIVGPPEEVLEALLERESWISSINSGCDGCRGLGIYQCDKHVFLATERDLAKAHILRLVSAGGGQSGDRGHAPGFP